MCYEKIILGRIRSASCVGLRSSMFRLNILGMGGGKNPGDDIKRLNIRGAWVKILKIQGAWSEISLRGYRTSSCQGFESRGRVLSACAASPHKFDT